MASLFYQIDTLDSYRLYEIITEGESKFKYKIYNKNYGNKPMKVYLSTEDLHSLSVEEILDSETYQIFVDFVEADKKKTTAEEKPSLEDWYEKDLFGNIVRKDTKPRSSYYPSYSFDSWRSTFKPEVVDETTVKSLSKSDTIVFHLTDPSTTMLSQIYKGKGYDEVHSRLNTPTVAALLDNHKKIICLGHGTSCGLIGMFDTRVREHFKDKNLFVIWCNADRYFDDGSLGQGNFITGNMPSEVWECRAAGCGEISRELMLENITYWSKLCADVMPQCLEGNVAEAVAHIRREYIKKYGDHPVTHYNAVRTMVHGDSYAKAEQEVKAIEHELNIHPDWDKYNSNVESSFKDLRSFNNIELNKGLNDTLKYIEKNFNNFKLDLEKICQADDNFYDFYAEGLLKELSSKYPNYLFTYDNLTHTLSWRENNLTKEESLKEGIKMEKNICCLCGEEYEGYGNNAQPLFNGLCCDECNYTKVIPARLKEWQKNRKTNEKLNESDKNFKFVRISHDDEIYDEDYL